MILEIPSVIGAWMSPGIPVYIIRRVSASKLLQKIFKILETVAGVLSGVLELLRKSPLRFIIEVLWELFFWKLVQNIFEEFLPKVLSFAGIPLTRYFNHSGRSNYENMSNCFFFQDFLEDPKKLQKFFWSSFENSSRSLIREIFEETPRRIKEISEETSKEFLRFLKELLENFWNFCTIRFENFWNNL